MKLLVLLTILTISFVIYYFVPKTNQKDTNATTKIIDTLPTISKNNHNTLISSTTQNANIKTNTKSQRTTPIVKPSNIQIIKKLTKKPKKNIEIRDYISLDEIKQRVAKNEQKKPKVIENIYKREVFEKLKTILQQSSSTYYAKRHIVLNSYISTILYNQHSKERFKELLKSEFGVDNFTIDEESKRFKTVWDWVNFLAP